MADGMNGRQARRVPGATYPGWRADQLQMRRQGPGGAAAVAATVVDTLTNDRRRHAHQVELKAAWGRLVTSRS